MKRAAVYDLKLWLEREPSKRKPLVIRGARQIGKSYLVRDFCARSGLKCLEINFEKEPRLKKLFVEGPNSNTISLLEAHFGVPLQPSPGVTHTPCLLFLDEIQAAPEVFARLRYFYEDSPEIPVIAAGSLLEFALGEMEQSTPVGRIEYLHLGPMRFEEFLEAQNQESLLKFIRAWSPGKAGSAIPEVFHDQLLGLVRDFSLVGGMPEAVARFIPGRDFSGCHSVQRSILETYRNDFAKYRKRIPLERLEKVFDSVPAQVGRKWVHARIDSEQKAGALASALDALCKARVAHRVHHSSGNGVPLRAERKDGLFKVLFLDVGLLGVQLGLRITDLLDAGMWTRVNEGAVAEQWIGQHLLDLRPISQSPEVFYWVREKAGAMAEVDYLLAEGPQVIPLEVKAGSTLRAKSLQVFLGEKGRKLGVHFSTHPCEVHKAVQILALPFYMVEQLPRLLNELGL